MMLAIQEVREKIRSKAEMAMISIVEDDKEVRSAICNLLESAGLRVEAFESAEEFLESGPMDKKACLVLDVRLPRMSGMDLQRSLYGQGSSLPIIFITGHADATVREEALRSGAADFLYKPFNAAALITSVYSALNRPQT
jgi:FixJ family two-component response regulator